MHLGHIIEARRHSKLRISDQDAFAWELLQNVMGTGGESMDSQKDRGIRLKLEDLGRGILIIAF